MSNWVFEITDYVGSAGTTTTVSEPKNWQDITITMKRNSDWHGIFTDYSFSSLQFSDDALDILEAAYLARGLGANTTLTIIWDCDTTEQLYTGKFDYNQYKKVCSYHAGCWIEIPVESSGALMKLKNRYDNKVNLDTATDFAGQAVYDYVRLGTEVTLPSKGIFKQDLFTIDTERFDYSTNVSFGVTVDSGSQSYAKKFSLPFGVHPHGVVTYQEFRVDPLNGSSASIYTPEMIDVYDYTTNVPTMITIAEDGEYHFTIALKTTVFIDTRVPVGVPTIPIINLTDVDLELWYSVNGGEVMVDSDTYSGVPDVSTGALGWEVEFTYATDLSLGTGDIVNWYLKLSVTTNAGSSRVVSNNVNLHKFTANDSYLGYSTITYYQPTECNVYMINEALSRTVEAITDKEMLVISDYFGRTDSQPYESVADGCGSLECITKGLLIRNAQLQGNDPIMAVSLKELFEGLKAIHCIGMGMEEDTDRAHPYGDAYQRIRVEQFDYFYQSDIILYCQAVNTLEISVNSGGYISTFKFGYEKYESEEYNGIDEFLTKREYRSTQSAAANELNAVCNMIASGYAIEVTRRKSVTTKDWRFDNDTFIICLARMYGGFYPETGNIDLGSNIVDVPTVYNFRISPLRNALRWAKILFAQHNDDEAEFKFTSGTGNYYAEGVVTGGCVIEREFAPNSELGNINYFTFGAYVDCTPLWKNERVKFEYPLTAAQFQTIKATPYGKIAYSFANGEYSYGWIDTLEYKCNEGIAEFVLIPER